MSEHKPDIGKLPAVLRGLPWAARTEHDRFYDGDQLLVAVPVLGTGSRRSTGKPVSDWGYEVAVVTVECDEGHFGVSLDSDPWGWSWEDVDLFVPFATTMSPTAAPKAWLDCRPYRRMADRIMEACIEATTYDELYGRCMDAMEEAEAGAKVVVEQAHAEKLRRIVRGDK